MNDRPTLGALWRSGAIARGDLVAAVEAYLEGDAPARLPVGAHHAVDVSAALAARPLSRRLLRDEKARESAQATAVFNALVRAVAEPL